MTFISSVWSFLSVMSSMEKLMYGWLIHDALHHKQNVTAKYGHGTFEIVATGDQFPPKLQESKVPLNEKIKLLKSKKNS